MIEAEGGIASAFEADVTREVECDALVQACRDAYGRIDILHNNVGIGIGDAGPTHLTEENWDRILDVNLKSVFLTCKHALPVMREQGSGVTRSAPRCFDPYVVRGVMFINKVPHGYSAARWTLKGGKIEYGS